MFQEKILPRNGYRMTTDPDEEPNFVSLLMADGLRRRNTGNGGGSSQNTIQSGPAHDKSTVPTQNIVNYVNDRPRPVEEGLGGFSYLYCWCLEDEDQNDTLEYLGGDSEDFLIRLPTEYHAD